MAKTNWHDTHPGGGGDAQRGGPPQARISRAEAQDGANNPLMPATDGERAECDATHPGAPASAQKFYLIEVEYVGPNARRDKGRHAHKARVQPVPGRKNMSLAVCVDGYLGTSNNWHQNAWGEFDSLADVAAKITELWNVVPVDLAVGDEVYL